MFELGFTAIWTLLVCIALNQVILRTTLWRTTKKTELDEKVILITGGGSGIGREIAIQLAKLRAIVVIWDIRQNLLDELDAEMKSLGLRCHIFLCDVTNKEMVYHVASSVKNIVGKVDILINNAGIVVGKPFLDVEDDEIQRTIDTNMMAHFWTVKAFLGDMIRQNEGHIVTIASVAGIVGMNTITEYSASKFGVCGFAESLRRELASTSVKTTLVCPWIIDTGLFQGIKQLFIPNLRPNEVAAKVIEGIQYKQELAILPPILNVLPLTRLIPIPILDFVAKVTGIMLTILTSLGATQSMKEFKGRGREWNMYRLEFKKA